MRVMLLAQWFPPIIGGEEWHVLRLGKELVFRDHVVDVVTLMQPGLPAFEEMGGVRVHRIQGTVQRLERLFLDPGRRSAAPGPDPELMGALWRIVRDVRPDVVHGHNWLLHPFVPIKRAVGVPLVVTLHDYSLVCARKDLMYRGSTQCSGPDLAKCLRCAAQKFGPGKGLATTVGLATMKPLIRASADHIIAVSTSVAAGNRLEEWGIPATVIPNFIPDLDPSGPPPTPDDMPTLPDEPFLLYVGAISQAKGVPTLLDAYAGMVDPPPLVLIGYPGAETDAILRDMPPGTTYVDRQPNPVVLEAWKRSRIGIVPSVGREASPTVVLEAMAAGTPVIASRIGGIPDMIENDVDGLLVTPGDPGELRRAISRILGDDALAARLGSAGAVRVNAFRANEVVPRIERVYDQVTWAKAETSVR